MTYKIIGADGKEYGPITADQLRQWIAEGRVDRNTRILAEGQTEWQTVGAIPELMPAGVAPAASAAPITAMPQTASGGQPGATNSLAIAGLVLGILSIPGVCCCYSLPFSIPGIVVSIMALTQINKNPNQEGKGFATAGLILSIAGILLGIGLLIFGVAISGSDWLKRLQNR
jgi:hypothetical protein